MTDREIIQRLIDHDDKVTRWFFYEKCRPLFLAIMRYVFKYPVNYDEFVNEIYLLLMEDDAHRLRQFDFRSSPYQWIKTVALRHFVNKRERMIEDASKGCPYNSCKESVCNASSVQTAQIDIPSLLQQMKIRRQAYVLQRLLIDEEEPKVVAEELHVTIDNLYNIKKRAITALAQLVLADKKKYKDERNIR